VSQADADARERPLGDGEPAARIQRPRWHGVLALACLGWSALAMFPGDFTAIGPRGIDPSWRWAVNAASGQGIVFGRDLVFTYGPLGFLLVPLDIGSNLLAGNLFAIALHALLVTGLVLWLRRAASPPAVAVGALLVAAASTFGLAVEGLWLLTVAWLAWLGCETPHRWLLDIAAALAGIFLVVKLSLGVAAATAVVLALVLDRWLEGRSLRVSAPLVGAAVAAAAAWRCFGSVATTVDWLRRSVEMLSGYSAANSIVGSMRDLSLGLLSIAAWAAAALWLRGSRSAWRWSLLLAPLVLLQFRLGFVRQDEHVHQLFGFLLAAGALTMTMTARRQDGAAVALSLLTVAVCALVVAGRPPLEQVSAVGRRLSGAGGMSRLRALLDLPDTRARLARRSAEQLADLRLPPAWLDAMGSDPGPLGTLPWECLWAPANGMAWDPTPTLQLYAAYTAGLDRWSARHYARHGPRFIVDEYQSVGMRHQAWDAPATWRTIYRHYRVRAATEDPLAMLLERRPRPLDAEYVEVGRGLVPFGTPVPVPDSPNLLFAELDLRPTLAGRLQKILFRVPPVMLVLRYASGRVTSYRVVPDTARNGILVNFFPGQFMERYLRLWTRPVPDPVVLMNLTGPGSRFYRSPAPVVWKELRPPAP